LLLPGQLGGPCYGERQDQIIPALIKLLDDSTLEPRRFAAVRLGLYRAAATNALPKLTALAESDTDSTVRAAAKTATEQIQNDRY
jgi:hypothetical protein